MPLYALDHQGNKYQIPLNASNLPVGTPVTLTGSFSLDHQVREVRDSLRVELIDGRLILYAGSQWRIWQYVAGSAIPGGVYSLRFRLHWGDSEYVTRNLGVRDEYKVELTVVSSSPTDDDEIYFYTGSNLVVRENSPADEFLQAIKALSRTVLIDSNVVVLGTRSVSSGNASWLFTPSYSTTPTGTVILRAEREVTLGESKTESGYTATGFTAGNDIDYLIGDWIITDSEAVRVSGISGNTITVAWETAPGSGDSILHYGGWDTAGAELPEGLPTEQHFDVELELVPSSGDPVVKHLAVRGYNSEELQVLAEERITDGLIDSIYGVGVGRELYGVAGAVMDSKAELDITALALAQDTERWWLVGLDDGTVKLWELTGQRVGELAAITVPASGQIRMNNLTLSGTLTAIGADLRISGSGFAVCNHRGVHYGASIISTGVALYRWQEISGIWEAIEIDLTASGIDSLALVSFEGELLAMTRDGTASQLYWVDLAGESWVALGNSQTVSFLNFDLAVLEGTIYLWGIILGAVNNTVQLYTVNGESGILTSVGSAQVVSGLSASSRVALVTWSGVLYAWVQGLLYQIAVNTGVLSNSVSVSGIIGLMAKDPAITGSLGTGNTLTGLATGELPVSMVQHHGGLTLLTGEHIYRAAYGGGAVTEQQASDLVELQYQRLAPAVVRGNAIAATIRLNPGAEVILDLEDYFSGYISGYTVSASNSGIATTTLDGSELNISVAAGHAGGDSTVLTVTPGSGTALDFLVLADPVRFSDLAMQPTIAMLNPAVIRQLAVTLSTGNSVLVLRPGVGSLSLLWSQSKAAFIGRVPVIVELLDDLARTIDLSDYVTGGGTFTYIMTTLASGVPFTASITGENLTITPTTGVNGAGVVQVTVGRSSGHADNIVVLEFRVMVNQVVRLAAVSDNALLVDESSITEYTELSPVALAWAGSGARNLLYLAALDGHIYSLIPQTGTWNKLTDRAYYGVDPGEHHEIIGMSQGWRNFGTVANPDNRQVLFAMAGLKNSYNAITTYRLCYLNTEQWRLVELTSELYLDVDEHLPGDIAWNPDTQQLLGLGLEQRVFWLLDPVSGTASYYDEMPYAELWDKSELPHGLTYDRENNHYVTRVGDKLYSLTVDNAIAELVFTVTGAVNGTNTGFTNRRSVGEVRLTLGSTGYASGDGLLNASYDELPAALFSDSGDRTLSELTDTGITVVGATWKEFWELQDYVMQPGTGDLVELVTGTTSDSAWTGIVWASGERPASGNALTLEFFDRTVYGSLSSVIKIPQRMVVAGTTDWQRTIAQIYTDGTNLTVELYGGSFKPILELDLYRLRILNTILDFDAGTLSSDGRSWSIAYTGTLSGTTQVEILRRGLVTKELRNSPEVKSLAWYQVERPVASNFVESEFKCEFNVGQHPANSATHYGYLVDDSPFLATSFGTLAQTTTPTIPATYLSGTTAADLEGIVFRVSDTTLLIMQDSDNGLWSGSVSDTVALSALNRTTGRTGASDIITIPNTVSASIRNRLALWGIVTLGTADYRIVYKHSDGRIEVEPQLSSTLSGTIAISIPAAYDNRWLRIYEDGGIAENALIEVDLSTGTLSDSGMSAGTIWKVALTAAQGKLFSGNIGSTLILEIYHRPEYLTHTAGNGDQSVALAPYFLGDFATYTSSSTIPNVVRGNSLAVRGSDTEPGGTNVTIIAANQAGSNSRVLRMYTAIVAVARNSVTVSAVSVAVGSSTTISGISSYFSGSPISDLAASSSDSTKATVASSLTGDSVTITGVASGSATITIAARNKSEIGGALGSAANALISVTITI